MSSASERPKPQTREFLGATDSPHWCFLSFQPAGMAILVDQGPKNSQQINGTDLIQLLEEWMIAYNLFYLLQLKTF